VLIRPWSSRSTVPAGAGKSTVARAVGERLGFTYLDTGAMYRAVALGRAPRPPARARSREHIDVELGDRVLVAGEDVTEAIRTPEITAATSHVAADPSVREALVRRQQEIVAEGDWVAEGRDIGTGRRARRRREGLPHGDRGGARAPPRRADRRRLRDDPQDQAERDARAIPPPTARSSRRRPTACRGHHRADPRPGDRPDRTLVVEAKEIGA
jgi:hypothetical protein